MAKTYVSPGGRKKVPPLAPRAAAAGAVRLRVEPSRAAAQACVVVSVPLAAGFWAVEALRGGGLLLDGARVDAAVVAYAMYEELRRKLMKSPVDAVRNRISGMDCGVQGGAFLVSVTCAPTFAAARKCAALVLQNLQWGRLQGAHSALCKKLGVAPDKAAFATAAWDAYKATAKGVDVVFAGKIDASGGEVAAAAEKLAAKMKNTPPKAKGARRPAPPADRAVADVYGGPLAAPGLPGFLAYTYVTAKEEGVLSSGQLYIAKGALGRALKLGGNGKKVRNYVRKFLALGAEARGSLVFVAAQRCGVAASDLRLGAEFGEDALVEKILTVFA